MYPLYLISGISGSGKTTIANKLAEFLPEMKIIDQDSFYLPEKPLVHLSDGSTRKNWDSKSAIDPKFKNTIVECLKESPVLISGFALTKDILPCAPKVHIHLITASNSKDLLSRCVESRKKVKPNIKDDEIMVKEVVIPFYHEVVEQSDVTDLLLVYTKSGSRVDINFLVGQALGMIRKVRDSNNFTLAISEYYYNLIWDRTVTMMTFRLLDKTLDILRKGDIIIFKNRNKQDLAVKIKSIKLYLDIPKFLKRKNSSKCILEVESNIDKRLSTTDNMYIGMIVIKLEII